MHAPAKRQHAQQTKRRDKSHAKKWCGKFLDSITDLIAWRLGLFDAVSGRKLRHLIRAEPGQSITVALSADGKRVARGPVNGVVRVWEVGTGKPCGQCSAAD